MTEVGNHGIEITLYPLFSSAKIFIFNGKSFSRKKQQLKKSTLTFRIAPIHFEYFKTAFEQNLFYVRQAFFELSLTFEDSLLHNSSALYIL